MSHFWMAHMRRSLGTACAVALLCSHLIYFTNAHMGTLWISGTHFSDAERYSRHTLFIVPSAFEGGVLAARMNYTEDAIRTLGSRCVSVFLGNALDSGGNPIKVRCLHACLRLRSCEPTARTRRLTNFSGTVSGAYREMVSK
jgi:hypothetical protein